MFLKITALSSLLTVFTVSAYAQTNPGISDDFFKVSKTQIESAELSKSEYQNIVKLMDGNMHLSCQDSNLGGIFDTTNSSPLTPYVEMAKDASEIVDEGNKIVDGLINIGQKIWTIVKAGKPVVNLNIGPSANALPKGVNCWDELETWQAPSVFRVKAKLENVYGYSLAEFQFDVIFTHGGSLKGKGKYLTHVQVFPSDVYAFWMQEFNASVKVVSITNKGTAADPIAAMQVDVQWQLKNFMNEVQQSASVYVTGDGQSKAINIF